jgi:methyl-accepting chemotaxis protein
MYTGVNVDSEERKLTALRGTATAISLVLMIVFIGLVLIYIKKTISDPIKHVTEAAANISNGEIGLNKKTNLDLNIKSNDEVGQLAQSIELTTNLLKRYFGEIARVLSAVSEGDLTVLPKLNYKGDLVVIKEDLLKIVENMNRSMQEIKNSAAEVSNGAAQVSDGAQALSQGATEQAGEIDQLSDLIRDITGKISANASNATGASDLAADSARIANESQNTMLSLSEAMAQISDVTTKMEKVVKTIDNFAFQTNVLALNATVEAARAGSYGRGFAIVAEEVRSLASKSATAAKETGELIENTVEIVETGVSLTNTTTEEFSKIVSLIDEVNTKVEQIADASTEQAAAASKIVVSVDEISKVIQTTSATAEESAAASQELSGLSQSLENIVNNFKLEGDDTSDDFDAYTPPAPTQRSTPAPSRASSSSSDSFSGDDDDTVYTGDEDDDKYF